MPGTIHTKIVNALSSFAPFQDFRAGRLTRDAYVDVLERDEPRMASFGLNRDQFHLSGRFPADEEAFVDGILADLRGQGAIPTTAYDKAAFTAFRRRVMAEFNHGEFSTYIFPEEERLVYALSEIAKPVSAAILGSYYGYWAIWTMPALARSKGRAWFLDIDERVNKLGLTNFTCLGFGAQVEFVTRDAVKFLEATATTFDFALIDAEGPEEHSDPDYRKKYIYYPIFKACLPRLRPDALVAVHNMLLSNLSHDRYFQERIVINQQQFHKLMPFLGEHFRVRTEYPTSEGVGVYRR
jgi:predicted O-methyltransferase YrrM